MPSRVSLLEKVVTRLLPQAGGIGVYLNGYERVPAFLRRRGITVARSQDHGDLRDNGKFFFLGQSSARFYAAADDDLDYPHDYVEYLKRMALDVGSESAVGVHGAVYPDPFVDLLEPRHLFHFEESLAHLMPVHLLGTGTVLFDQDQWGLDLEEFAKPGMADVWFAAAAALRGAPLFVVPRPSGWVAPLSSREQLAGSSALYFEALLDRSDQTGALREARVSNGGYHGLLESLGAVPSAVEELGISQSLLLDSARSALGYPAASLESIPVLVRRIEERGQRWSELHRFLGKAASTLGQVSLELLSDHVDHTSIELSIDLLDRVSSLREADPSLWATLPSAVRFDTDETRFAELKAALFKKAVMSRPQDPQTFWSSMSGRVEAPMEAALAAEQQGAHTDFAHLPAFTSSAAESPRRAATRLYEYFESVRWKTLPAENDLREKFGEYFDSVALQLLLAVAATKAESRDLAAGILDELKKVEPASRDVALAEAVLQGSVAASTSEALRPALRVLDQDLIREGLRPFSDALPEEDEGTGHWIHSLRPERIGGGDRTGPAVSVVMTTFNDEETVEAALGALLQSTDVNLQLIAVDDASTDGTLDRLLAVGDDRVTVIHNDLNVGPYVSRNRALEIAEGEFIAIADGDDWCHPQRLSHQAGILSVSPGLVACKVAHVRVRGDGLMDLENHLSFVGDGPVTLMFRSWVLDHVGGFDLVRTRGDIEFIRRLGARFGSGAVGSFDIPMLLANSSFGSNSKLYRDDVLNVYRSASAIWHERYALSDNLYVPLGGPRPAFVAPSEMRADELGSYEVVGG